MTDNGDAPQSFTDAVASMNAAQIRRDITASEIPAPKNLAPCSYALGLEVERQDPMDQEGDAFGRLILLHDPGSAADMRLVTYIQADMDLALSQDPLLPRVTWQWLQEGLDSENTQYDSLGGTVTCTNSVTYGDIDGAQEASQLELRASWTVTSGDLASHVQAFATVLAHVAGLPPEGITALGASAG